MTLSRFRQAKEEQKKRLMWFKTEYPSPLIKKNQCAYEIFEEWQSQRVLKVPIVEILGLFKNYDYHHVGVMSLIFKLG